MTLRRGRAAVSPARGARRGPASEGTETLPAVLGKLHAEVERDADRVLGSCEQRLRRLAGPAETAAERALWSRFGAAQRDYLVGLTGGDRRSGDRKRLCRRLARAHEELGLSREHCVGTWAHCLELLEPYVRQVTSGDCDVALRIETSLGQLLLVDLRTALGAMSAEPRGREHERSVQRVALDELAASVAHEVRNPLAGMKGALEILRADLFKAPREIEAVDELLAQIARLEHLVRDLLTFAVPRRLHARRFDLHALLSRVLDDFRESAAEAGVRLRHFYGPQRAELVGDPRQLEEVFSHLIHNALQAMRERVGGTLTVSTTMRAESIGVCFEDTGCGMTSGVRKRAFQPFFTTKHRGSGLGLPIVRRIVDAHAGRVALTSDPKRGTRVALSLPLEPET